MRLKDADDLAAEADIAGGAQQSLHLGWVMGIVIYHRHRVVRENFKPAMNSGEALQRLADLFIGHPHPAADSRGGQGVLYVVPARHAKLHRLTNSAGTGQDEDGSQAARAELRGLPVTIR